MEGAGLLRPPTREAERAGFEPATQLSPGTRFPVALLRPARIPDRYWRLSTLWAVFGAIATLLRLANLCFMVFKPE
jgi:hypothetical protein